MDEDDLFVTGDDASSDFTRLVDDLVALLAPSHLSPGIRNDEQRRQALRRQINDAISAGGDPLLARLGHYAAIRDEATQNIRLLLAYARAAAPPTQTYRLRDTASATGLTTSGVRTAWTAADLAEVIRRLGVSSRRATEIRKRARERKTARRAEHVGDSSDTCSRRGDALGYSAEA